MPTKGYKAQQRRVKRRLADPSVGTADPERARQMQGLRSSGAAGAHQGGTRVSRNRGASERQATEESYGR